MDTSTDTDDITLETMQTQVQCSVCESPVVLVQDARKGYILRCACENTVSVEAVTDEYSVFEPISGKWSTVDDSDFE